MSNPNSGSVTQTSRMPHPWHGWWRRSARLALAVLACAFAGAGQAQERYDHLDHAVNSMIREIVDDGELREQSVFVGAGDFFEEASEFDLLRPRLSEVLRAKCRTALTRNGVGKLEMVESEAAWVLHGRWWRETRESREYLHLRLFIARPVEGDTPPQEGEGDAGLVPITGVIRDAVKPTLLHWGDSVVRQLERDLPGTGSRSYLLHIRPFEVRRGAVAQPESLGRHLHNRWRRAFTGSRRLGLVGSTGFDGELFGEVSVTDEHVEVDLYVQDSQGEQVAAAFVTPDKGLFSPDFFGPDVTAELAKCAGLVEARNLEGAKECYEEMRAGAPGDARVIAEARSGLERIAKIERDRIKNLTIALRSRDFDFGNDEGRPLCNIQGTGGSCNVKAFIGSEIGNDRYRYRCRKLDQATYLGSCLNGKLNGLVLLDADGSGKNVRQIFLGYFVKGRPLYPLVSTYSSGDSFSITEKASSYGCVVFGKWDSSETRDSCPKIKRNFGITMTRDVARSFLDGSFDLKNTERKFLGRLLR